MNEKTVAKRPNAWEAQSVFFGLTRSVSTLPESYGYQLSSLNSGLARLYFITYWTVDKLQATSHYLHHLLTALFPFPSDCFLAFTPLLFLQQPSTQNTVHSNYCNKWDSTVVSWLEVQWSQVWIMSQGPATLTNTESFFSLVSPSEHMFRHHLLLSSIHNLQSSYYSLLHKR